jgi:response regulator of citrate/malate metabolism
MKQKNEYNQKLENDIITKISKYLEKHSKIELLLATHAEIAKQIGISLPSFRKYLPLVGNQLNLFK